MKFLKTGPLPPRHLCSFLFITGFLVLSCQEKTAKHPEQRSPVKDTVRAVETRKAAPSLGVPPMQALADSGKPFFKVAIYKNKQLFATYEGDWAIALQSGKLMTIQFPASKRMLKIAHGLIIYFNSPGIGTFQLVPSGNEKGKPVVIFSPEIDGAYGIGVTATSGEVNMTSYEPGKLSGTIHAVGKDTNGEEIEMQVAFINLKNNISD